MEKIEIRVYAKINLKLDINGVYEDGYHSLNMLATSLDIYDEIIVEKAQENSVYMDGVLQDETNTATKALQLLEQAYGYFAKVEIKKNIPFMAGLGGSSADAAGVFYAYGLLYGIDHFYMNKLAQSVGSDVVYMMQGGLCAIKCRGEMIFPKEDQLDLHLVVAQKEYGASTKDVYMQYDKSEKEYEQVPIKNDVIAFNVLEKPATTLAPNIAKAKEDLLQFTDKVFMTGSGSAYVGVFDNIEKAKECASALKDYIFVKACDTKRVGVEIISFS